MICSTHQELRRNITKETDAGQFYLVRIKEVFKNSGPCKVFSNYKDPGEVHKLDAFKIVGFLKGCADLKDIGKGLRLHAYIQEHEILRKNSFVINTLISMYARCGLFAKARQLLEELPIPNVVTWNALIAGYVQQGQGEEALKCFHSMQCDGYSPDAFTFTCALKACVSTGVVAKGKQIHDKIVSMGMLEKNIVLGNALVDMYAKCGALILSQQVLEELPVRNVITWTALITGYAQEGLGEEALKCFDNMLHDGHSPDAITFTCALKACGLVGTGAQGSEIHENIMSLSMLDKNMVLGSALVDMYARCGALAKALQVFSELPVHDVISWTALIAGYAQQGKDLEAVDCFEMMQSKGVKPSSTTMSCVLNACSHSGLLAKAELYFSAMTATYGITPGAEHFGCMVDLFGRAGKFKKALDLIKGMPSAEHFMAWVALLGACHKWGEVQIGRVVFECALDLDKSNAALYVCMAHIYTAAGMQEDADKIEVMRGK